MDIINIQNWTNEQVLLWFRGLDDSLLRYEPHLKAADIVGEQLLSLSHDDLHNLRINLVGHQELILDAVSLLQQLDFGLDSETLQSRALCLKCRCRGLRSTVATRRREAEEYEYDGGVSLQRGATNQLLHLASDVLDEGKQLILWLDRAPFNAKPDFRTLRDKLVQLCYELSVTMQQSVFACVIEDAALNICVELENSADGIVQSSEPLTIQPVSLEQVHLRDVNPDEGLGLFIKATFEGHHVVTGTRNGSIASRMRRITSGDEVIAVNGKTVVGWTLGSLVAALKEHPHEVALLMKKRPQTLSSSSSNLLALFQRNEKDRSKLIRVANPVKRIDTPTIDSSHRSSNGNSRAVSVRSSMGTWSSHKSHEPMEETSSEKLTSGSDMSDQRRSTSTNESGNSSLSHATSKVAEKVQCNSNQSARPQKPLRRTVSPRMAPAMNMQQASKEPSSPIDVLNIPPPPPEPYTPKTNHLSVERATNSKKNGRSASPNSMMDIEHRRRYTVIGGSTVDHGWYEDFLAEVNKCNFSSSSGCPSRDKISSNEEVFTNTPPSKYTSVSSLYQQHQRNFAQNQRRSKNVGRPVSMPPNYYCPVKRVDQPLHHPLTSHYSSRGDAASRYCQVQQTATVNYRHQNRNNKSVSSSNYYVTKQEQPSYQHQECYKREIYHSRYNSSNNNNKISESRLSKGGDSSTSSSYSSKNPPKPPPRSSSITKLSHRLSLEIRESIDHSRQSSLPVEGSYNMEEERRPSSLSLQKPSIPHKPSHIHPVLPSSKPTVDSGKKAKSESTPHLSNRRQSLEIEQLSPRQLSASDNKLKYSPTPTTVQESVETSPRYLNVQTAVVATVVSTKNFPRHTDTQAPVERPVPKPRKNRNKTPQVQTQDEVPSRERSNSQGVLLVEQNIPIPSERLRRKSAGHVTQKTKIETILDSLKDDEKNGDEQQGNYSPSWRSQTSRHSPSRGSYNAAMNNVDARYKMSSKSSLAPERVPQLNDSYDFKVIAGVPVRLRKSISRLAGNKLKTTPEKGKASQSSSTTASMKRERRVSCRDLGCGDCQGWLWKKKSGVDTSSGGPLSTKWVKCWVVIKDRAIYCYRSNSVDDDKRAECYISLPGYKVAPAPECKRKFAFHISHLKRKTFFFAAERQMDMSRWMNKMGLAAIEYKYETPQENGEKVKDEDYYSESDEDRDSPKKSSKSTATQRKDSPTDCDGMKEGEKSRNSTRPHTIASVTVSQPNGDVRTRCKSDYVKSQRASEQSVSSTSSGSAINEEDTLSSLPPSPRRKPNVKSDQRRHRGDFYRRMGTSDMSRSLDSLMKVKEMLDGVEDSKAARYKKARDKAAEKAEILKQRQMSLASPSIMVDLFEETSPSSSVISKSVSLSTFYFGDTFDQQSLNATSSTPGTHRVHSLSSPALSSVDFQALNTSRRDVAGRPKVNFDSPLSNSSDTSPTHHESSSKPSAKDQAEKLQAELSKEDPLDDMCKSLKQSEIDIRGISRRTTLRRKMTILSRDPQINERMLRKRALERELKAKELELAYFEKLLSKENITHNDLHAWINQHPSLVAELGTIRRISKKQRHLLPQVSGESNPLDGDKPSMSSEDDASCSTSGSERDSRLIDDSFNKNKNNSNNHVPRSLSRGRPRSGAFNEKDFHPVEPLKSNLLGGDVLPSSDKTRTSSSVVKRKKILKKRQVAARTSYDKPYLETDL